MSENREKPFYIMMFFSLLAAGSVFLFATMVTIDGLKIFAPRGRAKAVFHHAIASAFGNFGAATGDSLIHGKVRSLAADPGSFMEGSAATPSGRNGPARTADGASRPGGFNADLFDTASGLVLPRFSTPGFHGGRATSASSEYYESGDVPGTLLAALPKKGPRAAGPSSAPASPPAPSAPEKQGTAKDRGTETAPPGPGAERNAFPTSLPSGSRPERPGASGAVSKWDSPGAARPGADPDPGNFDLQGIKAGAIKNSVRASGDADPKAAQAAGPAPSADTGKKKIGGVLSGLTERLNRSPGSGAGPETSAAPTEIAQKPSSSSAAPAVSPSSGTTQESEEISPEEARKINALLVKALDSIQSGYGPMATLFYTDCADSPLCKEHELKGGFLTMTTETGAMAQLSAKKTNSVWQTYTLDFKPPPETEAEK